MFLNNSESFSSLSSKNLLKEEGNIKLIDFLQWIILEFF